jgi:acyl-CoA synthetase (AMP-forming)/AMP-acid ligase II
MTNNRLVKQIEAIWSLDASAQAIEYKGRWITWGDLRESALGIERALTAAGIGRGAAVGLILRNRPGLIAALLALLVSDRCIISLSAFQPAHELHRDLRKLRLPAVIADADDWNTGDTSRVVQETGALGLSLAGETRLSVQEVCARSQSQTFHEPLPGVALEILSSGTTGPPKRIRISFNTMEDSIIDGATSAHPGSAPTLTLKTTPTLLSAPLMHTSGMFGALVSIFEGRPIVLLEKFAVHDWVDAVEKYKIRFASLPPTPMRMVLDAHVPKEKLASLIAVRAGTAPLPVETQRQFEATYGVPVLVQYGATEWMGGIAGWTLAEHKQFIATKLGSVGRPRGRVKLRVVDADTGEVQSAGQMGVLEVMPEQRLGVSEWTRTSDLASIDDDGFLYIHGRADDTIIRGGFKVLLSHVVDVLTRHEAVLDAAVIGMSDPRVGQVPVAAVELRHDVPPPTVADLEAFARKHLPPYAVPTRFKIVDSLPRTVSMKVIRPEIKALFESS